MQTEYLWIRFAAVVHFDRGSHDGSKHSTRYEQEFTAESWTNIIPRKLWYEAVQEAEDMIDKDVQVDIQGYDIDPDVVAAARKMPREPEWST